MKQQTFSDYKKNEKRQQQDLEKLLAKADIPKDKASYDIREYGQKIQKYYDDLHPNKFRLFAFGTKGDFKPLWASDVKEYEEELTVLFIEGKRNEPGHYMPVIAPGRLFGDAKVYCFAVNIIFKPLITINKILVLGAISQTV
jgi:hypothetical protein